jgi:putative membrane protein
MKNEHLNISDHLANERTFLAWVRTAIGIMAFGFVVVKFSLFVKQLSLLLGKGTTIQQRGYSAILGIVLVVAGSLISVMAYTRFKRTERRINENNFQGSSLLISFLTAFIFIISIALIAYLIITT